MSEAEPADTPADRVRLDKWLWRARFFRTRTLAAGAVAAGRVRLNGRRAVKPGTGLKLGDVLTIRRAGQVHVVEVLAFGLRRGPAAEAALLYSETAPDPANDPATVSHLEDGEASE